MFGSLAVQDSLFSYTYDFRDPSPFGIRRNRSDDEGDLIYVPTGASDPLFDAAASFGGDAAELQDFLDFLASSGLNEYAGQIAPRNAFGSRWYTNFDLRIQQEIPLPLPGDILADSRATLFFDVENVGQSDQ